MSEDAPERKVALGPALPRYRRTGNNKSDKKMARGLLAALFIKKGSKAIALDP